MHQDIPIPQDGIITLPRVSSNAARLSTMFVADLHLGAHKPAITTGFLYFLRARAINAHALYILGDLFELWIGDDDPNPVHDEIAVALQALTKRGIPCYFLHGNRDLLLGKSYAVACGMTLLPAPRVIQFDGLRIVILHGDTLCTADNDYQRYRGRVHQRWLQRLFLSLPLQLRLHIADRIRAHSLRVNADKTAESMEVNQQAVMAVMAETRATIMIHGHTHRPAIHHLPEERHRAVLGAWHHHGSVIEISASGIMLHEFPLGGCHDPHNLSKETI